MLNSREKNQRLIELQLGDLTDQNLENLLRDLNSYIAGQKKKEMVQIYLEKNTYTQKEVVGEGARIEIITKELPKPPKKKRPRIVNVSTNIEVMVSTMDTREDEWLENHKQKLSEMMKTYMEGGQ